MYFSIGLGEGKIFLPSTTLKCLKCSWRYKHAILSFLWLCLHPPEIFNFLITSWQFHRYAVSFSFMGQTEANVQWKEWNCIFCCPSAIPETLHSLIIAQSHIYFVARWASWYSLLEWCSLPYHTGKITRGSLQNRYIWPSFLQSTQFCNSADIYCIFQQGFALSLAFW